MTDPGQVTTTNIHAVSEYEIRQFLVSGFSTLVLRKIYLSNPRALRPIDLISILPALTQSLISLIEQVSTSR